MKLSTLVAASCLATSLGCASKAPVQIAPPPPKAEAGPPSWIHEGAWYRAKGDGAAAVGPELCAPAHATDPNPVMALKFADEKAHDALGTALTIEAARAVQEAGVTNDLYLPKEELIVSGVVIAERFKAAHVMHALACFDIGWAKQASYQIVPSLSQDENIQVVDNLIVRAERALGSTK